MISPQRYKEHEVCNYPSTLEAVRRWVDARLNIANLPPGPDFDEMARAFIYEVCSSVNDYLREVTA